MSEPEFVVVHEHFSYHGSWSDALRVRGLLDVRGDWNPGVGCYCVQVNIEPALYLKPWCYRASADPYAVMFSLVGFRIRDVARVALDLALPAAPCALSS